jgi:hypothetical protein
MVCRVSAALLAMTVALALAVVHVATPQRVEARAQAPQAAELAAMVGKEKKAHAQTVIVSPPLSAAEAKALQAKLQTLRALLLDTPALHDLHGYDWATHAQITGVERGHPVKLRLGFIAYPFVFNARANRVESSAEGPPFTIHLNDPEVILGEGHYRVDQEAHFTFAPQAVGELDGYPVYSTDDRFVVITKGARPVFVPVTQQEFLDTRIAEARATNDKRQPALEAELAGLSEAARVAPALDPDGERTSRPSYLAEPGARKSRAIVKPNPAIFDAKQPRTSIQLIVLGTIRYARALYGQVQSQIDKAALANLFD